MRRILICTGVLGGGTALVFALAALTATLFPHGTLVQGQWGAWGGGIMRGGVMVQGVDDVMVDLAPAPMENDVMVEVP